MQTRSSDENSICLSVKRVHCDKTEERSAQIFIPYDRSFNLVFNHRKSNTHFTMSLRWSPYIAPNPPKGLKNAKRPFFVQNRTLIALQADYVTVVEDRPIMSVKHCLPVPVFHFWLKLTHPAARSLCDSWATCLQWLKYKTAKPLPTNVQLVYRLTDIINNSRARLSCTQQTGMVQPNDPNRLLWITIIL